MEGASVSKDPPFNCVLDAPIPNCDCALIRDDNVTACNPGFCTSGFEFSNDACVSPKSGLSLPLNGPAILGERHPRPFPPELLLRCALRRCRSVPCLSCSTVPSLNPCARPAELILNILVAFIIYKVGSFVIRRVLRAALRGGRL